MLINKQTDIRIIKEKYATIIDRMRRGLPPIYNVYMRPIDEEGTGGGLFEIHEAAGQFYTDPITRMPKNTYEQKGFRLLRTADEIEAEFNKQIKDLEDKHNKKPVDPKSVKQTTEKKG